MFIDETEIRKTIQILKPNNQLFEVRLVYEDKKILSGYFTDADTLIKELKGKNLAGCNAYMTLNVLDPACYDRMQHDKFEFKPKATTSDNDVIGYNWLMVDLDPKRPTGTSASNEQLDDAKALGNKVYWFMKQNGFCEPVVCYSGNGVHLLYKVVVKKTAIVEDTMKKTLTMLDVLFTNDKVGVDVKNFNPSRVCKLYGTLAQKGRNSEDRPHRMSRIAKAPEVIQTTELAYFEKVANMLPKKMESPHKYNNYNPKEFSLDDWLSKHGLNYEKASWSDGEKYILDCCPFDSNHTGKDACIFRNRSGAIGFHCFHNSCAGKTWQDVRVMYEPDAYDKKRDNEYKQMYQSFNRDKPPEPKPIVEREGEPVFYTALDVCRRVKQKEEIIASGIELYDKRHRGFRKKDVTILSGYTGGSKSTLLSELILNAVDTGNNVACFSGELAEDDYFRWMNLQAAGKSYVSPSQYENYYNVEKKYQERIANWLEGHFWLYNNKYGFKFEAILDQLEKMIDDHKLDMLCIDNLMALDISSLSRDKYDAQSMFAWKLHELAQVKNVHIIVVCHPKKPNGLLGLYDVSGTSDIVNAVDNIIYVYRVNQQFRNFYRQEFDLEYTENGTNAWCCVKARNGSIDDRYNPLYFEPQTKRLKNDIAENRIYGWLKDANGFSKVQTSTPFDKQ